MKTARLAPALSLLATCALCSGWASTAAAADAHAVKSTQSAAAKPAPEAATTAADTAAQPADPMEQLRRRLTERLQKTKSGSPPAPSQQALLVVAKPGKPPAPSPVAKDVEAQAAPATKPTPTQAPEPVTAHTKPANSANLPIKGVVPVAAHLVSPPVHGATPAAAPPHGAALPAAPAAAAARAPRVKPPAAAANTHGSEAHWDYTGPAGPQTWGGLKPEFSLCGNGQRQSPIDIRGGLSVDLEPVRFEYQSSRFSVIDNGHTVQANMAPGNAIEIGGNRCLLYTSPSPRD